MKVIEILMAEHQLILKRLEIFQSLTKKDIQSRPELVTECVEFVRAFADTYHHAKEEDILFQWMLEKNPGFKQGPIAVMLSEHDMGRTLINRIDELLLLLRSSDPNRDIEMIIDEMHEKIAIFCNMLTQHIHKEDNVLYQFAENINAQTQDGDAMMLERFSEVNHQLADTVRKYAK